MKFSYCLAFAHLFDIDPAVAGADASITASSTSWHLRPSSKFGCMGLFCATAFIKIGRLIAEGVLVANRAARHPPLLHIRMHFFPHRNLAPALHVLGLARIEIPEPRHVFQIEIEAAQLAIDLEVLAVLAAVGEARGFEVADGAVRVFGTRRWKRLRSRSCCCRPRGARARRRRCWLVPATDSISPQR